MGESDNCLQSVQLPEGGSYTRRGRNETLAILERSIFNAFSDLYVFRTLQIEQKDLKSWGFDPSVVQLVFGEFSLIVVEEDFVRVEYSD